MPSKENIILVQPKPSESSGSGTITSGNVTILERTAIDTSQDPIEEEGVISWKFDGVAKKAKLQRTSKGKKIIEYLE